MIGWMSTSEVVRRASTLQNNFSRSLILPQKQTSSDMKKKILLISLSTLFCVALVLGGWYWYASTTTNPWNAATLGEIPTPMGYKRVEAPAGSYAEFLRALPLKPRGSKVNYYTGGELAIVYFMVLRWTILCSVILSNALMSPCVCVLNICGNKVAILKSVSAMSIIR